MVVINNNQQFQKNIDAGTMTQAQADQIKASSAKFGYVAQLAGFVISPVFIGGLTPFWGGLIIWLGGVVFGRRVDYMKAVEGAGLPLMILAAGALVKGLLAAAMGSVFVSPGPVLLMKQFDATNPLHTMLLSIDVFVVWALALRGIALAKLTGVSTVKATVWVFGIWIAMTGTCFGTSFAIQKIVASMSGQH